MLHRAWPGADQFLLAGQRLWDYVLSFTDVHQFCAKNGMYPEAVPIPCQKLGFRTVSAGPRRDPISFNQEPDTLWLVPRREELKKDIELQLLTKKDLKLRAVNSVFK